jgi:hypothetical protein
MKEMSKTDEEQFYELLDKMRSTHDAKRHDYASDEDRFSNLMLSELMDIPAWVGCLVRISDKYSRLTEFAKKGTLKVKDESIEDTFLDMAVYALIGIILYRRAVGKVPEKRTSIDKIKEFLKGILRRKT